MRNLFLLVLILCTGLCACPDLSRSANTVNLATLDWEPYIGEKLKDQGYVATLVREAYRVSGYTSDLKFMPWARVVAMAREGKFDGYLPEYYSETLKKDFLVSEPFPGGPLGFFKRKGENISFKTLEDLKDYTIGVVRGYVNTEAFDKASFLQKDVANNDLTNLKKLIGKRIDLAIADKFVGLYLLKQEMPDKAGEVEFILPPLEEKNLYLCIAKKAPDAEAKLKAFNEGLKIIRDNGTLSSIMKANGF